MTKSILVKASLLLHAIVVLPSVCLGENVFQAGVAIHLGRPKYSVQAALAAVQSTELSFRGEAYWSSIETSKGILSWPSSLQDLDILVDAMAARHLRPVLILDYGNNFYDGGGQPYSNEGINAYVKYAMFVVNHFKNRIDQFEIWNEWSIGTGAHGAGSSKGDAVQYTNLLRATYKAIKAARPDVVVLGGGTGTGDKQSAWVTQFVSAGGLDILDGFSVHPYVHCDGSVNGFPLPPRNLRVSKLSDWKASFLSRLPAAQANTVNEAIGGTPEEAMSWLDNLHEQFAKSKPGKSLPLYVTEIGWPSSEGQCGIPPTAVAAYLQRFFLQARSRPWIAGVWWYDLFDDGNDGSNREHRFGLYTTTGVEKPAAGGLQSILQVLSSATVSMTVGPKGEYVASGSDPKGKSWYAAWIPTNDFSFRQEWPLGLQLESGGYQTLDGSSTGPGVYLSAMPVIVKQP